MKTIIITGVFYALAGTAQAMANQWGNVPTETKRSICAQRLQLCLVADFEILNYQII